MDHFHCKVVICCGMCWRNGIKCDCFPNGAVNAPVLQMIVLGNLSEGSWSGRGWDGTGPPCWGPTSVGDPLWREGAAAIAMEPLGFFPFLSYFLNWNLPWIPALNLTVSGYTSLMWTAAALYIPFLSQLWVFFSFLLPCKSGGQVK